MGKAKKRRLEKKHAKHFKPLNKAPQVKKPHSKASKHVREGGATSIVPYGKIDRILLVGEGTACQILDRRRQKANGCVGDFSFSRSLVFHHGCRHVLATCFDSEKELLQKYPQAKEHTSYLCREGQRVLYAVDATQLSQKPIRKPPFPPAAMQEDKSSEDRDVGSDIEDDAAFNSDGTSHNDSRAGRGERGWDTISFNFPHVGGKSTDVNRQVRANQSLCVAFFEAALPLLAPKTGIVLITLFEGEPYTLWNIKDLARHAGYRVERSWKFDANAYPGYKHARTLGNIEGGGGWKGEDRSARTYAFVAKDAPEGLVLGAKGAAGKKRRREDLDTEDEDGEGAD